MSEYIFIICCLLYPLFSAMFVIVCSSVIIFVSLSGNLFSLCIQFLNVTILFSSGWHEALLICRYKHTAPCNWNVYLIKQLVINIDVINF
jgi:hypothetical protein